MATRVFFIRHGETAWNQVKRIQGHLDIPLAPSGLAQAKRLAERFAFERGTGGEARQGINRENGARRADKAGSLNDGGAPLDAIYSSDLQRAQQTAQPTAAALGLPVRLHPGLRERAYGVFQGHDSDEIAKRFPADYAVWQTRDPDFAPKGGESSRMFFHRILQTVASIVGAHPGGRIACITHGGALDCIYRHARRLPLDVPRDYPLLNASINTVDFHEDGDASIIAWADVDHLSGQSDDDGFERRSANSR